MSDEEVKPIVQSRWVKKSKVERYDKRTSETLASTYREADGWHNGARVVRRGR